MATSKYLDTAGLSYLWDKIKAAIPSTYASSATANGVADKTSAIPFGKLDSTSTATVMTAQVDGISELRSGVCMFLMNGVVTSTTNFTININGLGAKPVYSTMAAASRATTLFNVNYTGLFVFNETRVEGGCWDFYYGYNSNDNTVGYNVVEYYSGTKRVKTASQRYQVMLTCFDGLLLPVFSGTYTTAATKTLTTEKFNPLGQIYYYNTTTNLAANNAPANGSLCPQAAYTLVDLRYSFNTASTLTAGEDIYLVCKPNTDGSAVLHSEPIAKALPTTEDGLLYKRLGKAYDTYRIILELDKPCYYYKNGAIREWTGVDCLDSISQLETFTFAKADKTSNAEIEAIKGNTVVWNQMVRNLRNIGFTEYGGLTITYSSDMRSIILNGTATQDIERQWIITSDYMSDKQKANHKYLFRGCPSGGGATSYYMQDSSGRISNSIDYGEGTIAVGSSNIAVSNDWYIHFIIKSGTVCKDLTCTPFIIDLTQMFGAGKEPSTVEEFESWLTQNVGLRGYYPYNAGELIPVKTTAIKTVGLNQWDEELVQGVIMDDGDIEPSSTRVTTSFIPVFPNTKYYLGGSSYVLNGRYAFYDSEKELLLYEYNGFGVRAITTPNNARYLRITLSRNYGTTYNHDICISLSSSRNGDYEAHWSNTASLDITSITGKLNGTGESVSVFPDGMKKAGSVYDEIKIEDGVVKAVKRVGSVDLGTLSWRTHTLSESMYYAYPNSSVPIAFAFPSSSSIKANVITDKYGIDTWGNMYSNSRIDKTFSLSTSFAAVYDTAYTDVATFKNAMSGVILYYELELPEEYVLDDFTLPITIKMDEYGTKLMLPENTSEVTSLSPVLSIEYPNETTMMIEEVVKSTQNMVSITYSELKALRDSNKLIAGMQYRITDYVTTTVQSNTQSAEHQFDVIVRADSTNVLNEDAYAALHNGDTYFANSKLEAWELKYCLDNDAMRFAWADVTNGKGVIYYMKDEWNNECPYDFKNILFRYDDDIYVYAFSFYYDDSDGSIVDASIKGNDETLLNDESLISGVYGNIIKECCKENDDPVGVQMFLNNVVFVSKESTDSGFFYGCTLNTIGKGCEEISFADNCHRNMLDSNCVGIALGEDCIDNSFGNNCFAITLVGSNSANTFEQLCGGIILNEYSNANTFMLWCNNIIIGENSRSCIFEPNCAYISFGIGSNIMNYYCNIHIGRDVQNVNIASSSTTTISNFLKNIDVAEGLCGSVDTNRLTLTFDTNKDYVQRAGRNSSGTVRIYCPDDEPAT